MGNSNYPSPYHPTYSSDGSQPYANAHSTIPYNGQQMNSYNPPYRPQMNQDMYNSGQQYGRVNQPHYSNWERDNQTFNSIPPPNGPVRNNQVQMPPPHPHFNHQQMAVSSPSHSPRSWPNAIPQHSPRATPSPMAVQGIPSPSLSTRSPGLGKQFSPSPGLPNVNHSFEFSSHQNNSSSSSSPSNGHINAASVQPQSSTTTTVDSNDPLQSLQKMVMIESQPVESPVERANYEVSSNSSLHSAPTPKCASDFSNIEQLASNEYADSPGPTYYNLDDGKTVNSKLHCIEETSQGSYSSEHGVGDHHFSSVPPMEHINYSQPMKGIPVNEPSAYHPAHQNGYPQHMYPQNLYSNTNMMPQKPGRRKMKKYDGNFAEINNPPGKKRRKGRPISPAETYSPNCYPSTMPSEYPNPAYNATGMMNGPMMINEDSSEIPIVVPKKRTYTKRAKVNKPETNVNKQNNLGTDINLANNSEESGVCTIKPKRKYSPRRKLIDTATVKISVPNQENKIINGRVSPVSISSIDGPVKITKVPNIISKSNNKEAEESKDSSAPVPAPVSIPLSVRNKTPLCKEVSVKIVPLSASHPERTIITSEDILKSENCSETDSVSNSVCSSAYSIPRNGALHNSTEETSLNSSDSLAKKKGRPKGRGDSENCARQRKVKVKVEEKFDDDDKSNDLKKLDDKLRTPSGPYVHIEGSRDNPSSITIINTSVKDEVKKDSKHQQKKKVHKHISNSFNPKRKFGHVSTLSAGYDTQTKDKSWVCILCHNGSHCEDLGDLFGPYCDSSLQIPPSNNLCNESMKNTDKNECDNISNQRTSTRLRRRRSDGIEPVLQSNKDTKQGKTKESTYPTNSTTPLAINNHVSNSCKSSGDEESSVNSQLLDQSPDTSHEFWVHEECISWANGVCIVGHKLIGIEEAVRIAMEMARFYHIYTDHNTFPSKLSDLTICTHCGENGATLGCLAKNCVEKLHFACAKEKGNLPDQSLLVTSCQPPFSNPISMDLFHLLETSNERFGGKLSNCGTKQLVLWEVISQAVAVS
ncbi:Transcription factor 20 [Nymphon striatum]|nr:Transcription factor 20 [Nymphon striatum]